MRGAPTTVASMEEAEKQIQQYYSKGQFEAMFDVIKKETAGVMKAAKGTKEALIEEQFPSARPTKAPAAAAPATGDRAMILADERASLVQQLAAAEAEYRAATTNDSLKAGQEKVARATANIAQIDKEMGAKAPGKLTYKGWVFPSQEKLDAFKKAGG